MVGPVQLYQRYTVLSAHARVVPSEGSYQHDGTVEQYTTGYNLNYDHSVVDWFDVFFTITVTVSTTWVCELSQNIFLKGTETSYYIFNILWNILDMEYLRLQD